MVLIDLICFYRANSTVATASVFPVCGHVTVKMTAATALMRTPTTAPSTRAVPQSSGVTTAAAYSALGSATTKTIARMAVTSWAVLIHPARMASSPAATTSVFQCLR
jgi:hypothetical protein